MAINFNIYSNGNTSTKTLTVDFASDFLASSSNGVSTQVKQFFKFTTPATTQDGENYGARISESLSDLVLNKEKQRMSNTAVAYTDIKSMIVDYMYDYVNGHDANEWGTTVSEQKPMKFN